VPELKIAAPSMGFASAEIDDRRRGATIVVVILHTGTAATDVNDSGGGLTNFGRATQHDRRGRINDWSLVDYGGLVNDRGLINHRGLIYNGGNRVGHGRWSNIILRAGRPRAH